jgi:hypothetical protein
MQKACRHMKNKHNKKFLCCKHRAFWNEIVNDQRNAQAFNLFMCLLLPYMFRAFF